MEAQKPNTLVQKDRSLFRRILGETRPYWPHVFLLQLLNLLSSPLGLLAPLPIKIVIDNVIGDRPLHPFLQMFIPAGAPHSSTPVLILAIVLLIIITVATQLQSMASTLLRAWAGERMVLDFRAKLFRHVQRLSLSYHDMNGTSDSTYRIQYDSAAIQYVTIDGILPFITSTFSLVAMFYVTARIDWRLALVALAISPVLYRISQISRPLLRNQSREVKNLESLALSVVQEVLSVVRVVKAFGMEDHEQRRYVRHSMDGLRARIRMAVIEGGYTLSVGLTTAIGTAGVIWIGVRHIQSHLLTPGDLLLVISYIAQLYDPLKTIGRKSASLQGYLASAERAFAALDHPQDVVERADSRPLQRAAGDVEFRNVSFGYEEGHPILHEISFRVPAGSRLGIAGKTGAGKTTLLNLLTRFYDPVAGQILVDGVDSRDYKLADLRNQFAIVLQEPVLFSTTIAENIAYGRPDAGQEEIVKAAKLADAHDFILSLPQGYDTLVGERGMRLSGGERQRISLARAFLKDAPILLLDEPTSSVDTRTEAAIMAAMERLMQGRTTFIIAHRLSTLDNCDLRVEIEYGRIKASGNIPVSPQARELQGTAVYGGSNA